MKCPYCNNEMKIGIIRGVRDPIKWIPKENDKGRMLSMFVDGITILEWYNKKVDGYYCKDCEKMIIDIPKELNQN